MIVIRIKRAAPDGERIQRKIAGRGHIQGQQRPPFGINRPGVGGKWLDPHSDNSLSAGDRGIVPARQRASHRNGIQEVHT